MSIEIICPKLWTYSTKNPRIKSKAAEGKLPLSYLDKYEYTHIHGELIISIDGRPVPHLGYKDDVCIGYWVNELVKLFTAFKANRITYIIYGNDQGHPNYKFEKEKGDVFLSIIESELGGKRDPNWQRILFDYKEFKDAFEQFKELLLCEIELQAPDMVNYWNEAFYQGN